ncbi:E3 ubiquitin-protein ligase HERC2-like isoform X1 [Macaca nemestrina]|uniref:E3 ubiquitin-protein ligase HERC2-like isoform X1 n=1 Tax=Macaca nemestrina TaxID=9545 RepID=UPI0039B98C92
MPSDSFCLAAQARLDSKWLKTDIQLHAAISHQVDPEFLGLGLGSVLLNSLKQTVVTLASSAGVLSTVQSAAQSVLQSGWSVLLPTAKERARALSALLPCAVSGNDVNISPGRRFMIDLLVGSLMADGGLESALHAAITAEIQDIEAKKEAQKEKEIDEQEANASTFHRSRTPLDKDLINTGICESSGKQCLPLVQLIQQLLRLSAMARSWLTATSTSRVQVILLPQPVKQLGLQACATMPS